MILSGIKSYEYFNPATTHNDIKFSVLLYLFSHDAH